MSNTNAPVEFVQIDVEGDGNCFYRAVYIAIKYHPSKIQQTLLKCLGIPPDIDENLFCQAMRDKLAKEIRGDLFERMKRKEGSDLYETLLNSAKDSFLWNAHMNSASRQFRNKFKDRVEFLRRTEEGFKKDFAEIISKSGVYASETDYKLFEYLLSECNVKIISVDPKTTELCIEDDGQPVLLVRKLKSVEHYNAIITKKQYEENKTELVRYRRNRVIYKGRKTCKNKKHTKNNETRKNSNGELAVGMRNLLKIRNSNGNKPNNKNGNNTNNITYIIEKTIKLIFEDNIKEAIKLLSKHNTEVKEIIQLLSKHNNNENIQNAIDKLSEMTSFNK
jgi:hypothetical protein